MPDSKQSLKAPAGIQVITRAANVLRALEDKPNGLSLGQIGERVGLARSTVQRIVDALRAEQLLIAASPTSGVRLGPALIRLAASASLGFDQVTRPIISALSHSIGETVDLSVLKGNSAVFTDQIQGSHRLRAVSAIGETFPIYCTANGKAMLSVLPVEEAAELLRGLCSGQGNGKGSGKSGRLPRLTPNTITRPQALLKLIASYRRSGIAVDDEEHTEGISALGTGFIDPIGRVIALSIPVPTARFRRIRPQITAPLLDARDAIVKALGIEPQPLVDSLK
jgi:DNA-binding IclR family transcriptional regulator